MASSIHTVAYKVEENGEIIIYNRYNNTRNEYRFRNITEAFGPYAFLVANIL